MIFVIYKEETKTFSVNVHRLEKIKNEAYDEEIIGDDNDEIIPNSIHHEAEMRKETNDELLERLAIDGFIYEGDLPEFWEADFDAKTITPLAIPSDYYSSLIKMECRRRINDAVSANTRENMVAEMGRLQFEKPTGWEARMSLIMLVLNWVRAMMNASRSLVVAQDAGYQNDDKWPVLSPETQSIIAEL